MKCRTLVTIVGMLVWTGGVAAQPQTVGDKAMAQKATAAAAKQQTPDVQTNAHKEGKTAAASKQVIPSMPPPQSAVGGGDKANQETEENNQNARRKKIAERNYQQALDSLMPMKPGQIRRFQQDVHAHQKALRDTPAPNAVNRTVRVSVQPGAAIPTVTVSPKYGAALTILGVTGQPWPITSATVGNGETFHISRPVDEGPGSSILTVSALKYYGNSNVILTLKSMPTPIIVRLRVGQTENNGRTDLMVEARGPNAIAPVAMKQLDPPDSETMRYLLDGVPPGNAHPVGIEGGPARAWIVGNQFFVRTALSVMSPAWLSSISGSQNMRVYELPITPTITAMDNDGSTVVLRVAEGALIDGALARGATTSGAIHYGPDNGKHGEEQ